MQNLDSLVEILNIEFKNKSTSDWVEILINSGVPCGPILNIEEILNHEQIKEREMIINIDHTKLGQIQISISQSNFLIQNPGQNYHLHCWENTIMKFYKAWVIQTKKLITL